MRLAHSKSHRDDATRVVLFESRLAPFAQQRFPRTDGGLSAGELIGECANRAIGLFVVEARKASLRVHNATQRVRPRRSAKA